MNVLMLSPGYPAEMPEFTRGLAEVGATVIGVGDQPAAALPEKARRALAAYIQVGSLFDEERTVAELRAELRGRRVERVESLWEPLMLLAARLREALGAFDRMMRGYLTEEAVLVGVESRTSSPVRVPRDAASLESPDAAGLYPCGDGAGYAGGIVSAALDGIRIARAITSTMKS